MLHIHHLQHLSKQFYHYKDVNNKIFLPNKRWQGRILSMHLKCFKHDLKLCAVLHIFFYPETLKDIMTACIICIIWSLKMSDILTLEQMTSIMIKSMIVNPNRCHIPPRVTLCSSLNVTIPLEIEEFILNFKWISSSIYGNYKASRRNLELWLS